MSEKTILATLDKDDVMKMLVEAFKAGTTSYFELAEDYCSDLYEEYVSKKILDNKKVLIQVPDKVPTTQQNNMNFFRDIQHTVINSADFLQVPTLQVSGTDITLSSNSFTRIANNSGNTVGGTTLFDTVNDINYNYSSNRDVQ